MPRQLFLFESGQRSVAFYTMVRDLGLFPLPRIYGQRDVLLDGAW
jgi:hypothetical protein